MSIPVEKLIILLGNDRLSDWQLRQCGIHIISEEKMRNKDADGVG